MSNPKHLFQRGRWLILLVSLVAAVVMVSGCGAQAAPKTYRVGILSGLDALTDTTDGFKEKMAELGYIEGENIVYDVQITDFDMAAYERIAQKFVADKADLIFVFPTEASLVAKAATQGTNTPVVFANSFIEGVDLIESVRKPGDNITGVRWPGPDLAAKSLEILLELAPAVKRVGIPYLQGYPTGPSQFEALRLTGASLGVTLVEIPVTNMEDMQADLQARVQSGDIGLDAILLIADPLIASPDVVAMLTDFGAEHKVLVGNGDLYDLRPDFLQTGQQSALLADKILRGTSAGTIPVVSSEGTLTINYKRAQELGLTVPEGLLSQADEIIR